MKGDTEGNVGPTGDTGRIGDTGRTGDTGQIGRRGQDGLRGPAGAGERGPMGPVGPVGPPGLGGGSLSAEDKNEERRKRIVAGLWLLAVVVCLTSAWGVYAITQVISSENKVKATDREITATNKNLLDTNRKLRITNAKATAAAIKATAVTSRLEHVVTGLSVESVRRQNDTDAIVDFLCTAAKARYAVVVNPLTPKSIKLINLNAARREYEITARLSPSMKHVCVVKGLLK